MINVSKRKQNKIKQNTKNNNSDVGSCLAIIIVPLIIYYIIRFLKFIFSPIIKLEVKDFRVFYVALLIAYIVCIVLWSKYYRIPVWKKAIRAAIFPTMVIFSYLSIYSFRKEHQVGKGIGFIILSVAVFVIYLIIGDEHLSEQIKKIIFRESNSKNDSEESDNQGTTIEESLSDKVITEEQNDTLKENKFKKQLYDPYIRRVGELLIEEGNASVETIIATFKIDTIYATTIMNQLEEIGLVGKDGDAIQREILIDKDEFCRRLDILEKRYEENVRNELDSASASRVPIADYSNIENIYSSSSKSAFRSQLEEMGLARYEGDEITRSILRHRGVNQSIEERNNIIDATVLQEAEWTHSSNLPDEEYNYIDDLDNILITSTSDEVIKRIVDSVLNKYSPSVLKVVLCDFDGLTFSQYQDDSHLLVPVILNVAKAEDFIRYTVKEINARQEKIVQEKVGNIHDYNSKSTVITPLVRIMLIIDEAESIFNSYFYRCREELLKILLSGQKVGIHIIFFSRYKEENLIIGGKEHDLIRIIDGNSEAHIIKEFVHIYQPDSISASNTGQTLYIADVDKMDGTTFEHFCKQLLSTNGFTDIMVTPHSSDYGADVIAKKDEIRYVIQCKCYSGNVGEDAIREVFASKNVYGAEVAVVLTNSYFTNQAKVLAKYNSVRLWDRNKLMEMMKAPQ